MNDPANIIQWKIGDLVIHDADAKEPRMLMVVTGYLMNGCVVTKYVSKELKEKYKRKNRWINSLAVLHDPNNYEKCKVVK